MTLKERLMRNYAAVFAKPIFRTFNFWLIDFGLRGIGVANYQDFKISGEAHFIKFIKSNFNLKTIFDVGANVGKYAEYFANDGFNVHAFEPVPSTYARLSAKFENNKAVKCLPFGCSDQTKNVEIFDYAHEDGTSHASLYEGVITEIHNEESKRISINLKTIDEYVNTESIDHISLLKIDTEGNEYAVLKGALDTIRSKKIDIIHIEFNEMNVMSKVFFKDFVDLIPEYNFYRLLPKDFLKLDYKEIKPLKLEFFAFQNIVAFRKDIDVLN